jgi:hypothetical protein
MSRQALVRSEPKLMLVLSRGGRFSGSRPCADDAGPQIVAVHAGEVRRVDHVRRTAVEDHLLVVVDGVGFAASG